MTEIRKATEEDLPVLMEIFRNARGIMRASGNMNQWNDSYPSEETILADIEAGNSIVMSEQDRIIATMAFIPGPEATYSQIYDGKWENGLPYYVIHRIAVAEPGHGAAAIFLDWAFEHMDADCSTIRIDTHKDNVIMHHILKQYGFKYCGVIYLSNGHPRDAYLKTGR